MTTEESGPPKVEVDPLATFLTVSANNRFSAAWSEVNARIAQRQNAMQIFVTLATATVGVIIASRTTASGGEDLTAFAALIPIISIVFGTLNYKHDRTIAILRQYMTDLEKYQPAEGVKMPGYNSDEYYRHQADLTRTFHDIASAVIIIVYNFVGWYFLTTSASNPNLPSWISFLYTGLTAVSVLLVIYSTFPGHRFEKKTVKNDA